MPPLYQNPFSEKKILGPGETDPAADVELARTLLGDEAAEEYAEALAGSSRGETLTEGFTDEEKAVFAQKERELKEWEVKRIPGERIELTIGGKTKEELLEEMKAKGIKVDDAAKDLIYQITFPETKEHLALVKLTVSDLGFTERATTEEMYAKAKELGLDLVPPETGIYLRLQYTTQPEGKVLFMGMDPITVHDEDPPSVFRLGRDVDGLWLSDRWAGQNLTWSSDGPWFVFRIPDTKK